MSAPAPPRPRAAPRAAAPRRLHPRASRAVGSLLAGAATCGALLALDPVLAPGSWLATSALALGLATALLAALRSVWGSPVGPTAVTAAACAAALLLRYGTPATPDGDAPTGAVAGVGDLLREALRQIDEGVAPLAVGPEVALVVTLGALAVLLLLDLAVALDVPVLGGLALLVLWAPTVLLGFTASGWALVCAGLPWLALVASLPTTTGRRARLMATAWAAGALTLALGLAPVVAAAPGWGTVPLPQLGTGSGAVSLSDDLDLRRDLQARSTQTVLTYTLAAPDGSASPVSVSALGPLRSFTVTDFDGRRWSVDTQEAALTTWQDGQLLSPDGPDLGEGTAVEVTVTIDALADSYLPLTLAPRELDVTGDWLYDPARDLVLGTEATTTGTTYRMIARIPTLTAADLQTQASQSPTDRGALTMPGSAHDDEVAALAAQVAEGQSTSYGKALALQTFLRTGGGFVYDEQVAPATSEDAVWDFLQDRRGYCVQFATAMVVMARSLGLPARLAVGFLPGTEQDGTVSVTGSQAHAWPEIWFDQSGWVRFEPTPAIQTGAPPAWTLQTATSTASPTTDAEPTTTESRPTTTASTSPAVTAGSRSTARGTLGWWLAGVGAGLVGLSTWFWRRRPGRRGTDPQDAWAAVRRALAGSGLTWTDAMTPRQVVRSLRESAVLDEAALTSIEHIATEVERFRYTVGGTAATPAMLDQWVQQVTVALRSTRVRRATAADRVTRRPGSSAPR